MKKILAIVIALMMFAGVFAACGNETAPETVTGENSSEAAPVEDASAEVVEEDASQAQTDASSLVDITSAIYNIQSVEFMVGPAMEVDLADADAAKAYLGTADVANVAEATFSESMMGSQAYSLVLARVNDAAAVEDLKKAMFDGIDTAKWICVEADQLRVVSSGDIVMLVMASTELGDGIADGMVDAFEQTVGALSGETLTRG